MSQSILLDTGPLVALLDRRDPHHSWALAQSKRLPTPFLTCEPVLTEASHLLRRVAGGTLAILTLVSRGELLPSFHINDEAHAIAYLMKRYENVPMSLADACLVRMAELRKDARILTLDRDFLIYRQHDRVPISTILPPV